MVHPKHRFFCIGFCRAFCCSAFCCGGVATPVVRLVEPTPWLATCMAFPQKINRTHKKETGVCLVYLLLCLVVCVAYGAPREHRIARHDVQSQTDRVSLSFAPVLGASDSDTDFSLPPASPREKSWVEGNLKAVFELERSHIGKMVCFHLFLQ